MKISSEVIRDDPLATKAYFYRGVVCAMASQQAALTNRPIATGVDQGLYQGHSIAAQLRHGL